MGKSGERGPASGEIQARANGDKLVASTAEMGRSAAPLIIALNCLEDYHLEEEALAGVAVLQHVGLSQITDGRIEAAIAVIVHSLAFLPRAAQRRLQPWQLILCLGSLDKEVDSSLASDLGLHLLHVDTGRAEEIADTVVALVLGMIRHTHTLAAQAFTSSGWLGTVQPTCRGVRRCRGLVMGIIGRSPSACALAARILAFKMKVLYFDVHEGKDVALHGRINFPSAARKVETLNELLSASDVVSLHCSLTTETEHLICAEALQHLKPGALVVNTSSSRLLDDCALKQALIDGTVAGCALDGVEGPQWLEAWVRDIPNVLILPRSADYSEEVWMEIRAKAVILLRSFLLDGVVFSCAVSDEEDDDRDFTWQEDGKNKQRKNATLYGNAMQVKTQVGKETCHKQMCPSLLDSHFEDSRLLQSTSHHDVVSHMKGSERKNKKRSGRRRSQQSGELLATERDTNEAVLQQDNPGANISGRGEVLTLSSSFASPNDSKLYSQRAGYLRDGEVLPEKCGFSSPSKEVFGQAIDLLKEGYVVALRAADGCGYHVARHQGPGHGWCLDMMSNITTRDPAAQFLLVVRNRERIGLRSFAAGGTLLQANKKLEMVFLNHTFGTLESWMLEGMVLDECRLTNGKFPNVCLDVSIEILAAVGEDGVACWLS